jgi:diguanylate cyclase (GGDEF)-like protein
MTKSTLKLLHVENDDMEAEICQRLLSQEFAKDDYSVVRERTLRASLNKLRTLEFDAILLDLDLDDSQGLVNVRAIKRENPDVPIVVLSGHNDTEIALQAIRDGAQEYVVKGHSNHRMLGLAILSSIERKVYERQLFRQANHDELTGLPNRRMFLEYLHQWLVRASRWKRTEMIMFLDVNGFKQVNDTLGHDAGDRLLQQIAARLKTGLRASDMLARYAGDEFIVHLDMQAHESRENCAQVAERIAALFRKPVNIGSHDIATSVSIGVAVYPDHGPDTETLIRSADQAMYQAKQAGIPFVFAGDDNVSESRPNATSIL